MVTVSGRAGHKTRFHAGRTARAVLLASVSALVTACFNPLMTVDGRTALEQELTRTAILRAVDQIPVDEAIASGSWKIEVVGPDVKDADWIKSLLRQRLVSQGATISTDPAASLPVIQADVRFAGSDVDNFYLGVPIPGGGGKALSFYQSVSEIGRAGLGLSLWSESGKLLGQSQEVRGDAHFTDVFFLTLIGPISFTDLEDIRTAGRFVQLGKDKWKRVEEVKDWDYGREVVQD